MGGNRTGEHGIGMGKLKHMRNEHGDGAIETMKTLKLAMDPNNIPIPARSSTAKPPGPVLLRAI